jgi:hypothetical protein
MKDDLVTIFKENDQDSIQKFAFNLRLMDRASLFSDIYIKRILDPHVEKWKIISNTKDIGIISNFFSNVTQTCTKEYVLQRGFLEGYDNVPKFINLLFCQIDPSISDFVQNLGIPNFPIVVEIFKEIVVFSNDIDQYLVLNESKELIFKPFLRFQAKYAQIDEAYLKGRLSAHCQTLNNHCMLENISLIMNLADEVLKRCETFTFGYGSELAVETLAKFFKSVIEISEKELDCLPKIVTKSLNSSEFGHVMINLTDSDSAQFHSRLRYFEFSAVFYYSLKKFETEISIQQKVIDKIPDFVRKELELMKRPPFDALKAEVLRAKDLCLKSQKEVLNSLAVHIEPHVKSILIHNWSSKPDESDTDMPQFSQSPLTYMTAIGEYLVFISFNIKAYTSSTSRCFDTD